jgi:FtsZ-interacting cell division protein YlmF
MLLQWLDECIRLRQEAAQQQEQQQEQQQQQQQQQLGSSSSQQDEPAVQRGVGVLFAPVVGGASESERVRSAQAAAERDVAGEQGQQGQGTPAVVTGAC